MKPSKFSFVALFFLSGCGETNQSALESTSSQAIVAGVESSKARDAVVFLRLEREDGGWSHCTGTLVSPRIVLTAKHCVAPTQPGSFICRGNGDLVQDGSGAGMFAATADPSQLTVHVGVVPNPTASATAAKILTSGAPHACRDDFALITLDRAVESVGYPAVRRSRATLVGEPVLLLGYGVGEHSGAPTRRELGDVRIIDVGLEGSVTSGEQATTPPRSFSIPGGTVCFGDSGGPALSMKTGALLGVYSRIIGDCLAIESRNTFTLASGFEQLIDQAFEETGETPSREPALPGDERGDAGDSNPAGVRPLSQASAHSSGAFRCSTNATPVGNTHAFLSALLLALSSRCFSRRPGRRRAFSAAPADSARDV
ncbi:MAG TPA: trypsin-like serine protease [Polyangiaceae bacterium]|nr:trypsin-like serine protease [Polyangiaceae bacterium]